MLRPVKDQAKLDNVLIPLPTSSSAVTGQNERGRAAPSGRGQAPGDRRRVYHGGRACRIRAIMGSATIGSRDHRFPRPSVPATIAVAGPLADL
jgi:hypothetical protein